jgi:hypothetical protein
MDNEEIDISLLLCQESYWQVNKILGLSIGLVPTILLSDIISKRNYFRNRNEIDQDGMFYNTIENLMIDLGLSDYEKRKYEKVLLEKNLITKKIKGIPAKTYYKVNDWNILNFINENRNIREITANEIKKKKELDAKTFQDNSLKDQQTSIQNFKELGIESFNNNSSKDQQQIIIKNNNKEIKINKKETMLPDEIEFRNFFQSYQAMYLRYSKRIDMSHANDVRKLLDICNGMTKRNLATSILSYLERLFWTHSQDEFWSKTQPHAVNLSKVHSQANKILEVNEKPNIQTNRPKYSNEKLGSQKIDETMRNNRQAIQDGSYYDGADSNNSDSLEDIFRPN